VRPEELHAAAATRSELGGEYDEAIVRSLAARLDGEIDERIDRRLPHHRRSTALREAVTIFIALGSIGFGVLFAAAAGGLGETGATLATITAWICIVVINVVHARSR
jgi:hypothetical protein